MQVVLEMENKPKEVIDKTDYLKNRKMQIFGISLAPLD